MTSTGVDGASRGDARSARRRSQPEFAKCSAGHRRQCRRARRRGRPSLLDPRQSGDKNCPSGGIRTLTPYSDGGEFDEADEVVELCSSKRVATGRKYLSRGVRDLFGEEVQHPAVVYRRPGRDVGGLAAVDLVAVRGAASRCPQISSGLATISARASGATSGWSGTASEARDGRAGNLHIGLADTNEAQHSVADANRTGLSYSTSRSAAFLRGSCARLLFR